MAAPSVLRRSGGLPSLLRLRPLSRLLSPLLLRLRPLSRLLSPLLLRLSPLCRLGLLGILRITLLSMLLRLRLGFRLFRALLRSPLLGLRLGLGLWGVLLRLRLRSRRLNALRLLWLRLRASGGCTLLLRCGLFLPRGRCLLFPLRGLSMDTNDHS